MVKRFISLLLLLMPCLLADLQDEQGTLRFDANFDGKVEMSLNSTGLGIGTTPMANLHVQGDSILQGGTVMVGNSSAASSNLQLQGTLGFTVQSVTGPDTLPEVVDSSYVVVNSSDNLLLRLPLAADATGRLIQVKNIGSGEPRVEGHDGIEGVHRKKLTGTGNPKLTSPW